MEALVAAIPVSSEEGIVVLLYGPVSIDVSVVMIEAPLVFINKPLWSVELTGHLESFLASFHRKRIV